MYGIQESWGTDIVSALAAAFEGYATASLAKGGYPGTALITNAVLGVGGVGAKHLMGGAYGHEVMEALGYGGFAGLGTWAAEATKTYPGSKGPGAAPFWQPAASTTGAVRQADIARRIAAARAGVRVGQVQQVQTPVLASPRFVSDQEDY